jgi:hypothetical protein
MHGVDKLRYGTDLQRNYNFELLLPDFGGITGYEMMPYCQSVRLGEYNILDLINIRYGNEKRKYIGFLDIDTITAVFLKPTTKDIVTAYFDAWKGNIIDRQGFYMVKNDYARDIYVKLFDRNSNELLNYRFVGCFPKRYPALDLDYNAEDVVKYNIEFSVDRIIKQ